MDLEHPPGKTDFDVLREGHARVSAFYTEDNFNLGQWVGIQRASLSYIPIQLRTEVYLPYNQALDFIISSL